MEHKECCNPPAPRIHCSPLPADGLLGQYKTKHTHTHTTQLSDGCIPRPPAVSAAFDDVFNGFIHPKACSPSPPFFHPPYPSLQADAANTNMSFGQLCRQMTVNSFSN